MIVEGAGCFFENFPNRSRIRLNEGGQRVVEDRRIEPLVVSENLDRNSTNDIILEPLFRRHDDRTWVALVEEL